MTAEEPTGRDVLRRAIWGQRRWVSLSALGATGHQGGEALVPVIVGVVIDRAVTTGATGTLLTWLGVLAAVFVGLSFGFRFSARASERASEYAALDLRTALTARILDARGGADNGRLAGELTNIATADVARVGAVNLAIPAGVAGVVGLTVSAVALLNISIVLGLLVLLGTPPLLWVSHQLGKPLERRSEEQQERAALASGIATDLVTGLRVLKGVGAEATAVARYRATSRDSLAATLRAARAEAWYAGTVLAINGAFLAVVALVAGRLTADGDISIGGLVTAVGLAQYLLSPLSFLTWVNSEFAMGRASATRVAAVLASPPAVVGGEGVLPVRPPGRLRMRGVAHENLRAVDLDVAPGELLGVVATDPAAATALLACLARDLDPESGTVEIDGVPLTELAPDHIRRAVLVAAHDADLFEGTLAENVAAGATSAAGATAPTGDTLAPALAAAGADEVARALPEGVDAHISERGRSLSGGQRQRVALARALAADAPVLVLHDPTTAVDTVTEARVAASLRDIRRGRTTVLVATSPALLAVTDRVVVVDGGTVTAQGTHSDLLGGDSVYRAAVLS
ncbi:ABC transporter transmembrane domain-containing protein [Parafrankia discariae]|uniref:ABC transporter transmembrane domain-containing protein n=1 Tax=Parafrankia discariae TaxID=365528 RepID=UPI000477B33E